MGNHITRRRSSGILLHISSLPSAYGIGDLGSAAYQFADRLADAGQRWWQVLPMGPPAAENSPYSSHSAMAGNPLLVDPEWLIAHRLIDRRHAPRAPAGPIGFAQVQRRKTLMLAVASERFAVAAPGHLARAFDRFCSTTPWLEDFCSFMAIRNHVGQAWQKWPADVARRKPAALRAVRRQLSAEIQQHRFAQFVFAQQLAELRQHLRKRGIGLIGDMPIFVAADSSDVWSHPEYFHLDRKGVPTVVSGVPPDLFSSTGQLWGTPLYNWRAMARTGYRWWLDRIRAALQQVDVIRIDHFRGLRAYWEVPGHAKTARRGRWVRAPGEKLLAAGRREFGSLPLLAEDLGVITPDVEELRDAFHLPGMRVLQFAFGGNTRDPHLVHNHRRDCVVYTGTHDNDTTLSWYRTSDRATRERIEIGRAHV